MNKKRKKPPTPPRVPHDRTVKTRIDYDGGWFLPYCVRLEVDWGTRIVGSRFTRRGAERLAERARKREQVRQDRIAAFEAIR